jgi:hypothetical protein
MGVKKPQEIKPPGRRKRSQNWSRIYLADARESLARDKAADINLDRLTAVAEGRSCLTVPEDRIRKSHRTEISILNV